MLFIALALSSQLVKGQNAPISTVGNEITTGNQVTVPITAVNINDIGSCNQRLNYDPAIANCTGVTIGPNMVGGINVNTTVPGQITFGWYTFPGLTLPDNTVLFNLSFTKVSSGTSDITWSTTYTDRQWSDGFSNFLNDMPMEDYYFPGSVTFQGDAPITIAPVIAACPGNTIDIPITVQNFNTIGAISLTLHFDENVLDYQSWSNNSGYPGLGVFNPNVGVITAAAFSPSVGISLPYDAVLFTLHFDYLGGNTDLEWFDDDGSSCEYGGPPPTYNTLTDIPQSNYYIDGSVSPDVTPTWTGLVDSDWTESGNWSCDVPISTSDVTIGVTPNDPVIATDVVVNSLTIDAGASLTLDPTGTLEVTSTLTNNATAADLVLKSNASSTASLLHNTSGVEATIERYMPPLSADADVPVYHQVSVPLVQGPNLVSGLFLWSYLFEYNVSTQGWDALGTPTNTQLYADQGYLIIKDIVQPPPGFEEPDPTYVFPGTLNNGSFTCEVSYPGVDKNHNLVPNPYPSAIDWDATSGWTKNNIDDAIWIWNPDVALTGGEYGQYASFINSTATNWKPSTATDPIIPVGQAFFVKTNNDNSGVPVLTMDNQVRVHSSQEFFKSEDEIVDLLRIKAVTLNSSDEMVVRFQDESTNNFDNQYDAVKFYGGTYAPQLYSVADDTEELSINALPYVSDVMVVPVGFKLEESGLVSFEFSSIDSFDPSVTIFLEDLLTGTMIDLRQNDSYSFFHDVSNDPMRFKLIFNGTTTVLESRPQEFFCYYADDYIHFKFLEDVTDQVNLMIYNVNGQLALETEIHSNQSALSVAGLAPGAYIVKTITRDKLFTQKILVR